MFTKVINISFSSFRSIESKIIKWKSEYFMLLQNVFSHIWPLVWKLLHVQRWLEQLHTYRNCSQNGTTLRYELNHFNFYILFCIINATYMCTLCLLFYSQGPTTSHILKKVKLHWLCFLHRSCDSDYIWVKKNELENICYTIFEFYWQRIVSCWPASSI